MAQENASKEPLDIVKTVSNLLDSDKYKEALKFAKKPKYELIFKNSCWDLIPVVVGKVHDNTLVIKPSLYYACEELLQLIIEKTTPEEALLELIEQIEICRCEAQFGMVLTPLQKLIIQLTLKRGQTLEWCLNSIYVYIQGIPTPELYNLEAAERLLSDCERNLRRSVTVYSMLPSFYEPFVEELRKEEPNDRTKQVLIAFLISLMGKPLIYMDLDPNINKYAEARQICSKMILDLSILSKDFYKFLVYVESCFKEDKRNKGKLVRNFDGHTPPFEDYEKLNITTLSGFYYIVLSGHFEIPNTATPLVYSHEYIVNTAFLCVIHLLSLPDYGPQAKATALAQALLKFIPDNASHTLLLASVHYEFMKSLVDVAVNVEHIVIKQDVLNLIRGHIMQFSHKGRCTLIKYVLGITKHSGLLGIIIINLKNCINQAFQLDELPECFTGLQFFSLVKKICYLPEGAESDLVESGDHVITALNFLRFIALKDVTNKTGIKDFFEILETDYLNKLRIGVNMSKAHYGAKLRELEANSNTIMPSVECTVNIEGQVFQHNPADGQKEFLQSSMNCFFLIESLIARLSECISINRMQRLDTANI